MVLTLPQAIQLSTVVEATMGTARVRYLSDSGDVISGTARSIGDLFGNFARRTDDVRDCYLRITTDHGFDTYIKVSDLMEMVAATTFVLGD